jgi:hypothetical protein
VAPACKIATDVVDTVMGACAPSRHRVVGASKSEDWIAIDQYQTMTLVWLRRAERSLEAIADYIARENRQAAYTTILTIRAAACLIDNPA